MQLIHTPGNLSASWPIYSEEVLMVTPETQLHCAGIWEQLETTRFKQGINMRINGNCPKCILGESLLTWLKHRFFWKSLWRMPVLDRVKIHAWRLYYRAMPVYNELTKRGCEALKECCFCGFGGESVEHIFFQCWWSKVFFWKKLAIEEVPRCMPSRYLPLDMVPCTQQ